MEKMEYLIKVFIAKCLSSWLFWIALIVLGYNVISSQITIGGGGG